MAHEVIGTCACPVCGYAGQEVRKSGKSGKPYIMCDECGCQLFARQARSVRLLSEMAKQGGAGQANEKPDEKNATQASSGAANSAEAAPPLVAAVPRRRTIAEEILGVGARGEV